MLTDSQLLHIVIDALYTHCPRKPKEPNPMKHCPSMRLDDAIWPLDYSEWILFALARDDGAGGAASSFSEDAVENKD